MKITGRDLRFFFLGLLTFFIIETIIDWEGTKESFKRGYNSSFEKM